jgi:uncharacterized protein
VEYAVSRGVSESFLPRVFAWMFVGLLVTAAAAGAIGSSDSMLTDVTESPLPLLLLFVVQLGIVVAISARAERMSPAAATGLFLFYSATNGVLFAFVFVALIGLILATIVNLFVANDALYWITTYAGVGIFAGLTAYDMQKLKRYGEAGASSQGQAIQGALALYLDFINLFLFLLRIFGQARR